MGFWGGATLPGGGFVPPTVVEQVEGEMTQLHQVVANIAKVVKQQQTAPPLQTENQADGGDSSQANDGFITVCNKRHRVNGKTAIPDHEKPEVMLKQEGISFVA